MSEHVAYCHLLSGRLARKRKLRIQRLDAIVPTPLAGSYQGSHDRRCYRFRYRCNFKHGVRIDLSGFPNLAKSISLEKPDLALVDDCYCQTRNTRPLHSATDIRIHLGEGHVDVARTRRLRLSGTADKGG